MAYVSDNFVRADGALGGSWGTVIPHKAENLWAIKGNILIRNDGYGPINGGGCDACSLYTGTSFGNDQWASAQIKTIAPPIATLNITAVSGSSSTWTYTYTVTQGSVNVPISGKALYVVITGMQNAGNNGHFTATTFGSGTFTVTNASGHAESGSSGTGVCPSDSGAGIMVRGSGTTAATLNGYFFHVGTNSYGGGGRLYYYELWKVVNGTGTILGGVYDAAQSLISPVIGDTLALVASGTTITAYYNGVSLFSVTDSAVSSGVPGITSWSFGGSYEYLWSLWNDTESTYPPGNNGTTLNNFQASDAGSPTVYYAISGNCGIAGATVSCTGTVSNSVTSNPDGSYQLTGLTAGTYVITPSLSGCTFSPASSTTQTIGSASITGVNFSVSIPSYSGCRKITIDHTKCGGSDSVNFPVLLSGTYAYLATVANGGLVTSSSGYDIVFTSDAAGTVPLGWEIESYNATTGAIVFWVRVPNLSHSADTAFYMWYGNSGITTFQGNFAGGAWDSNYWSVQHLGNGSTLSVVDSLLGSLSFVNTSATADASGKIDGAATFGGSAWVTGPAGAPDGGNFTVDCWINPTSSVTNKAIWCFGSGAGGAGENLCNIGVGSAGDISLYLGSAWISSSTTPVSIGSWQHIAITFNSGTVTFYYNGVVQGTPATGKTNTAAGAFNDIYVFGAQGTGHPNPYSGAIDEIRVSSVARSTDWILAGFNNANNPATFYSLSSTISGNAGVAGATISYTGTATGSVTADGSGNYSITGLANGSYTITPSKTGYTFSPTSASETVSGADITGVNFTATQTLVATPTFSALDLQLLNKFMNWLSQL